MNEFIVFNKGLDKQLDKVIPVNPLTGLRDDLVHKYEIALTDSERANIQHYLETQNISNPSKQLKDKDLIALCPSRYVSTLSDMKQLAQDMRQMVASLDNADLAASKTAPSAEPVGSPSDN